MLLLLLLLLMMMMVLMVLLMVLMVLLIVLMMLTGVVVAQRLILRLRVAAHKAWHAAAAQVAPRKWPQCLGAAGCHAPSCCPRHLVRGGGRTRASSLWAQGRVCCAHRGSPWLPAAGGGWCEWGKAGAGQTCARGAGPGDRLSWCACAAPAAAAAAAASAGPGPAHPAQMMWQGGWQRAQSAWPPGLGELEGQAHL